MFSNGIPPCYWRKSANRDHLDHPEKYLKQAHNLVYRSDIQHTPYSRIAVVLHKDCATLDNKSLKSAKTVNPAFVTLSQNLNHA